MILGVGTDLCPIARMERAMQNPRFAARICTPSELAQLEPLCPERQRERLAGLFAAKEAVAKALGTGFTGFGFADVEILPDALGKPCVTLHGGAAALLDGRRAAIHLSITHDGGLALAFAVVEEIS